MNLRQVVGALFVGAVIGGLGVAIATCGVAEQASTSELSTANASSREVARTTTPQSADLSCEEALAHLRSAMDAGTPRLDGGDNDAGTDTPEEALRARNSQTLIRGLVTRLRVREYGAGLRGAGTEQQVNELNGYLDGFIDSVSVLSQDHYPALRSEVETALCSARSDVESMIFSRLSLRMPELASQRGLDCVLERHQTEDATLAEALDAYRAARLPPSAAWDAWKTKAQRSPIRDRLIATTRELDPIHP